MPSTALSTLLPDFGRYIGLFRTVSTTTNITTSTAVISTEWPGKGFASDDDLNRKWLRIKGTNNDRVIRQVSDYTGSTGNATVQGAALAAESAAVTVELYPHDPTELLRLLNQARIDVSPTLSRPIEYDTITSNQPFQRFRLPNSTGMQFVGSPTEVMIADIPNPKFADNLLDDKDPECEDPTGSDWTATNVTVAKESKTTSPDNYMVLNGEASAKLTAVLNTAGTWVSALTNGGNFSGEKISLFLLVYSRTADRVAVRLYDGTTATLGTAHNGNGWELIRVSATIKSGATAITCGLNVTSGAVFDFYADSIVALAGPDEWVEDVFTNIVKWQYLRPLSTDTDGYITFRGALPGKSWLKVRGQGFLSSVTAETDTMEVDGDQAKFLYAVAAKMLYEEQLADGNTDRDYARLLSYELQHIQDMRQRLRERGDTPPIFIGSSQGF